MEPVPPQVNIEATEASAGGNEAASEAPTSVELLAETRMERALGYVKGHPFAAIGGGAAAVAALLLASFFIGLRHLPYAAVQKNADAMETLYATRMTHVRNAPTSIDSRVFDDLETGDIVTGNWVLGRDGTTRWLHIRRTNGSDAYVWGRNLSAVAPPPEARIAIQGRSGFLTVRDFFHNGSATADFINPDLHRYFLASSDDSFDTPKGRYPPVARKTDFAILYYAPSSTFGVSLSKKPLADTRRQAEEFLIKKLGISRMQLCDLRAQVMVTSYISAKYAGRDLGFSPCAGAESLYGD